MCENAGLWVTGQHCMEADAWQFCMSSAPISRLEVMQTVISMQHLRGACAVWPCHQQSYTWRCSSCHVLHTALKAAESFLRLSHCLTGLLYPPPPRPRPGAKFRGGRMCSIFCNTLEHSRFCVCPNARFASRLTVINELIFLSSSIPIPELRDIACRSENQREQRGV